MIPAPKFWTACGHPSFNNACFAGAARVCCLRVVAHTMVHVYRTAYYFNVKTRQRTETMPKGFDELQREIACVSHRRAAPPAATSAAPAFFGLCIFLVAEMSPCRHRLMMDRLQRLTGRPHAVSGAKSLTAGCKIVDGRVQNRDGCKIVTTDCIHLQPFVLVLRIPLPRPVKWS